MFFSLDYSPAESYIVDLFQDLESINNKRNYDQFLDKFRRLLRQPLCLSSLTSVYKQKINNNSFDVKKFESWLIRLRDNPGFKDKCKKSIEYGENHCFRRFVIYSIVVWSHSVSKGGSIKTS